MNEETILIAGVGHIPKSEYPKFMEQYAQNFKRQVEETEKELQNPLPDGYEPMVRYIEPCKKGNVDIIHFEVDNKTAFIELLSSASDGRPTRAVLPGTYVRMKVGKEVMMSDTTHEAKTCRKIMEDAKGDVLIAGLGIGMILIPLLKNPEVKSITVIELNQNVIDLVVPQLRSHFPFLTQKKLKVVKADIRKWHSKKKYDRIWLDIWPNITPSNLKDIIPMEKRFSKNLKRGGWVASWMKDELIKWVKDEAAIRERIKEQRKKAKEKTNGS